MNSNNGRNNNTTTKNLEKYQKNSEERQNAAILFLFCCRFLVAEWCKIHGREVAGRLHCLCHQLQEVENKEQLSIFPAKTPAVAASVTVSPLFTILHRKALSHQQVDDAIGIKCVSTRKFVAFECCWLWPPCSRRRIDRFAPFGSRWLALLSQVPDVLDADKDLLFNVPLSLSALWHSACLFQQQKYATKTTPRDTSRWCLVTFWLVTWPTPLSPYQALPCHCRIGCLFCLVIFILDKPLSLAFMRLFKCDTMLRYSYPVQCILSAEYKQRRSWIFYLFIITLLPARRVSDWIIDQLFESQNGKHFQDGSRP